MPLASARAKKTYLILILQSVFHQNVHATVSSILLGEFCPFLLFCLPSRRLGNLFGCYRRSEINHISKPGVGDPKVAIFTGRKSDRANKRLAGERDRRARARQQQLPNDLL